MREACEILVFQNVLMFWRVKTFEIHHRNGFCGLVQCYEL